MNSILIKKIKWCIAVFKSEGVLLVTMKGDTGSLKMSGDRINLFVSLVSSIAQDPELFHLFSAVVQTVKDDKAVNELLNTILKKKMKYEIKLKVNLPSDKGVLKPTKEHYIISDAVSFADAEARGYALYNHEGANLDVTDIQRSKLYEIVNAESKDDTNAFYRIKITEVLVDKQGCDKETSYVSLFVGYNINDVTMRVDDYMKQTMADYRIDGIQRTKIAAVL